VQEHDPVGGYTPGNCNIGPMEIKRRYRIGYIGLVLMGLFIICAEAFHLPQAWKFFLFAPAVYAFSGFLQAWQKFCFLYGYMGVFSLEGRKTFSRIKDNQDRQKDRRKAIQLISKVVLGSSVITLLYYFLS
jgi:hypothetical protein